MIFARLSAANVHYGPFGKLQEELLPALRIMTRSVIAIHYSKYGELLEGPEDKPMLDNDVIAGDVGDAEKAGDVEKVGDIRNIEKVGKARDKEQNRHRRRRGDKACKACRRYRGRRR